MVGAAALVASGRARATGVTTAAKTAKAATTDRSTATEPDPTGVGTIALRLVSDILT